MSSPADVARPGSSTTDVRFRAAFGKGSGSSANAKGGRYLSDDFDDSANLPLDVIFAAWQQHVLYQNPTPTSEVLQRDVHLRRSRPRTRLLSALRTCWAHRTPRHSRASHSKVESEEASGHCKQAQAESHPGVHSFSPSNTSNSAFSRCFVINVWQHHAIGQDRTRYVEGYATVPGAFRAVLQVLDHQSRLHSLPLCRSLSPPLQTQRCLLHNAPSEDPSFPLGQSTLVGLRCG